MRHAAVLRSLAVSLSAVTAAFAVQQSVEVTLLWEHPSLDIWPGEITGDSVDELIAVLSDATVEPRDQAMLSAGNTASFPRRTFTVTSPVAGATDSQHMWVSLKRGDTAFLHDLVRRQNLPVAVGQDLNEITAGWDGGIQQVALADLGGDGRVEAVATLSSAWDEIGRASCRERV